MTDLDSLKIDIELQVIKVSIYDGWKLLRLLAHQLQKKFKSSKQNQGDTTLCIPILITKNIKENKTEIKIHFDSLEESERQDLLGLISSNNYSSY